MLKLTIEVGQETKTIQPRHLQQVTVDTTMQAKTVTFPTDAGLYLKGHHTLVRQARHARLPLRPNYTRLATQAFVPHERNVKTKQGIEPSAHS
ncbi:MAG: hypothetical protein NPIRA05_12500 [Nitrospirales bacterium]|nr:MAG: hypothetical protein NPIRA05_12500 [Nitrospirales bacterium]